MTHMFKLSRRTARLRAASAAVILAVVGACNTTDGLGPNTAADAADLAAAPSFATTTSSISIANLSAQSGKTYRVAPSLAVDSQLYVDRTYTLDSVPTALRGLTFIKTANNDKDALPGSTSFLSFDIGGDAVVYVAHDDRVARPAWLTANFQNTGLDLVETSSRTRLSVFKRTFPRGRVTLGSSVTTASGHSMYIVLVQPVVTASIVAPSPLPVGIAGLPTTEYADTSRWSSSLTHLTPGSWAMAVLASAKQYHARIVVSLAGGRNSFKDSLGQFDLAKWKANVDKWRSVAELLPYIADGTIVGHYLVDEPNWPGGWGGKTISQAQIEEMARYSKSIWPAMAAGVRVRAGYLLGHTWQYLDFAWAQWEGPLHVPSGNMTPEAWRDKETADALKAGVKLVFGMNFLDGGDGSSGIAGTFPNSTSSIVNRWQMSAAEVERVGRVLAAAPAACALISWGWSTKYPAYSYLTTEQLAGIRAFITRLDVRTAIANVGTVARNRTATPSCKR